MDSILFILLIFLTSCIDSNSKRHTKTNPVKKEIINEKPYQWTKLLDSAEWRKNYNFQMFSDENGIYVLHPDGTWQSPDGKNWTMIQLSNPIHNHAFLDYVRFNNAILGLGNFKGNIESFTFKPEIYKTNDMASWEIISKNSNLPKRFFYHPFEFKRKLWIIGGEDKNGTYDDIWNSADGINWKKVKENLPFGKRSGSRVVLLNDKLYLLNNDVWISSDALTWTKVTDEIVKGEEIFGYAALAYDNHIWLLGCNRNENFSSEVLYSNDGKNWNAMSAPWLPRGGIAATVYQDKIFMTGGKYGGTPNHPEFRYDNDVWMMSKGR